MRAPTDFTAELILVCNSLDAGGIERVVSALANEWARRGRRVCVVTLHDRRRFYRLDPSVRHVIIDRAGFDRLSDLLHRLAARLRHGGAPRFPLLDLLLGGPYELSYKRLYRAYSAAVYAGEAMLLRRALRRIDCPLVVPVNDASALAAALSRLARDPALRTGLGEAARARVAEYDLPRAASRWEAVLGLAR